MNLLNLHTKPLVIAEIGGKYAPMNTLKEIINAAHDAGADLVKFQTYAAETITSPGTFLTYEDGRKVSQYEFFKQHELTLQDHQELNDHCNKLGIGWFSTPSHPDDVTLLETFDPIAYKTGSDDLTNLPFLRYLAETGRPMVVSTGMCTLGEIEKAVETILATGNTQLTLLHCVVSYPSRPEDANLNVIKTLQNAFGLPIGLSDHTTDAYTSVLATALGAVVIEKHFCMDYGLGLPDSQAALDTEGLRTLVNQVKMVSQSLGTGVKDILPTEKKWRAAARKSIYSIHSIPAGQSISEADLTIRRPADGIHPHHMELIVGRRARNEIPANTLITWDMI